MPKGYEETRTPPKASPIPEEVILQTKRLLRPPSYLQDYDLGASSTQQVFDDHKEAKLDNLIQTCVANGVSGNGFVKIFSAFMIYFDQSDDKFISRRTYERKKKAMFQDKIDEHHEESTQVIRLTFVQLILHSVKRVLGKYNDPFLSRYDRKKNW